VPESGGFSALWRLKFTMAPRVQRSHGYFIFWKIGVDGSDVAIEEEAEAVAFP
jgi:hypothetical protein